METFGVRGSEFGVDGAEAFSRDLYPIPDCRFPIAGKPRAGACGSSSPTPNAELRTPNTRSELERFYDLESLELQIAWARNAGRPELPHLLEARRLVELLIEAGMTADPLAYLPNYREVYEAYCIERVWRPGRSRKQEPGAQATGRRARQRCSRENAKRTGNRESEIGNRQKTFGVPRSEFGVGETFDVRRSEFGVDRAEAFSRDLYPNPDSRLPIAEPHQSEIPNPQSEIEQEAGGGMQEAGTSAATLDVSTPHTERQPPNVFRLFALSRLSTCNDGDSPSALPAAPGTVPLRLVGKSKIQNRKSKVVMTGSGGACLRAA